MPAVGDGGRRTKKLVADAFAVDLHSGCDVRGAATRTCDLASQTDEDDARSVCSRAENFARSKSNQQSRSLQEASWGHIDRTIRMMTIQNRG